MHILFTMSGWRDEGGGTILPRQIALGLVRRGHRVTVVHTETTDGPTHPVCHEEGTGPDGVQLVAVRGLPGFTHSLLHPESDADDPRMRSVTAALLDRLKPDLVHYHSLNGFSLGSVEEAHRRGVPGIYTSHNYWPLCPRMYLFKSDLSLCEGPSEDGGRCSVCLGYPGKANGYGMRAARARSVLNACVPLHLTVSERAGRLFAQNGHDPDRMKTLHPQTETVDAIWRSLGRNRKPSRRGSGPLRVGFIGNLFAWKGVHVLVEALQAFRPGLVEGHIFGAGPSPYTEALHRLDRNGVVRFHGRYQPGGLSRLLGMFDISIVPSLCEETGGLVVLEALAARVPVAGSRIGGIPEFIREGENGFLFEPGNSEHLAGVLHNCLRDPGLLERMRACIEPPRGFDAYLDELEAIYGGVAAGH